jgi:tRNA 2-thiouridine synthesizing protein E
VTPGEVTRPPLRVAGRTVATDELGYLLDPDDWTPQVAEAIARIEGVALQPDHWAVLELVREGFKRKHSIPEPRSLLEGMAGVLGPERATHGYLHRLFPCGYGSQACKIAGMRMPRKVMLDP